MGVQGKNDGQRRGHRDSAGDDADERAGHRILHSPDVVVDTGHDLPGLRCYIETQRHALQVGEQLVAQVEHDRLTHPRVEIVLNNADQAVERRYRDHRQDQQIQHPHIMCRQRFVNDSPYHQRRRQTDGGRCANTEEDQGSMPAIGLQVGSDTPKMSELQFAGRRLFAVPAHAAHAMAAVSVPHMEFLVSSDCRRACSAISGDGPCRNGAASVHAPARCAAPFAERPTTTPARRRRLCLRCRRVQRRRGCGITGDVS